MNLQYWRYFIGRQFIKLFAVLGGTAKETLLLSNTTLIHISKYQANGHIHFKVFDA